VLTGPEKKITRRFGHFPPIPHRVPRQSFYAIRMRLQGCWRPKLFPYTIAGVVAIASETTEHTPFPTGPPNSVSYIPLFLRIPLNI